MESNERVNRPERRSHKRRWRFHGDMEEGIFVTEPNGKILTEVDDVPAALRIISIFNCHDDLLEACESGDWDNIDEVIDSYKRNRT